MALTECIECNHQVSDRATTCPACGAPVGKDGARPVTTTGKGLKIQELLAVTLLVGGFAVKYYTFKTDTTGGLTGLLSTGAIIIGFLWWFLTRARIWWRHE